MSQTKAQLLDGKSATIQFTGGSAAVPSVTFTGDLDTGIYSPGANQVAISTGGTERLLLTGGNVAIGVASPSAKLHISGSFWATNGELAGGNTASTGTDGTFRLLSSGGTNFFQFGQNRSTGSAAPLVFGSIFGAAEYMRITSAGLVGIGTSNPGKTLDVVGQLRIQSAASSGYALLEYGSSSTATNNWHVGSEGDGSYRFYNGILNAGAERLRITAAGNVGIGITSPAQRLRVVGDSGTAQFGAGTAGNALFINAFDSDTIYMTASASNATQFGFGSASNIPLFFMTNNTERARIDTSGRLLVGTSTALPSSTLTPGLQHHAALSGDANAGFGRWTNDAGGYAMYFNKSRGTTVGTQGVVLADDFLGALFFEGSDGTQMRRGAAITAHVDGTPGSSDMPGRLVFSTTLDGFSSVAERMRIPNGGGLSVGTTVSPSAVNQQTAIRIGALNISQTTITNLSTTWTDITVAAGANGLAFIDVFNASSGGQGNFLVSWRGFPANATVISSSNGTGLTINFQVSSGKLQMQTTSGSVSGGAYVWAG